MIDPERLRDLLRERGWSQAKLARFLGVTPPAIQQILSGKTKASKLQRSIARLFEVSEGWLSGESDNPFESVTGTMTPEQLAAELRLRMHRRQFLPDEGEDPNDNLDDEDLHDPAWLVAQISRFDASILDIEDPDFYPPVTTIKIISDAMTPTLLKGDRVLVSLHTQDVDEPDAIWWISYGGFKMIRRLMPLPTGGYRVSADNPTSPTFEAPASDIEVRGRAFWVGRPIA